MTKRMIENGFEPVGGPPEKFGELIRAEIREVGAGREESRRQSRLR